MFAQQTQAEEVFVKADAGPRMELWGGTTLTLFGAASTCQSGWGKLGETFPRVASRFSGVSDFRFDVEALGVSGDMAYYTIGFERFTGSCAGREVEPVLVRVTLVYRRKEGEWKIVHRHADNPGPDTRMEGS